MADINSNTLVGGSGNLQPGAVVTDYNSALEDGRTLLALNGDSYLRSAYPDINGFFPYSPGAAFAESDQSAITFGTSLRTTFGARMITSNGTGVLLAAATASNNNLAIMRSTDNGITWTQVYDTGKTVPCVGIHFCQNGYAYIFVEQAVNQAPAFVSSDSGATWASISIGTINGRCEATDYDPVTDKVYILTNITTNGFIIISNASNASPSISSTNNPISNGDAVAVSTIGGVSSIIGVYGSSAYTSTDDGGTWSTAVGIGTTPRQGSLYFDGDVAFTAGVNGAGVWKSANKGTSWSKLTSPITGDEPDNVFYGNGYVVLSQGASIYISSDDGVSFGGEINAVGVTNIYSILLDANSSLYVSQSTGKIDYSIEDPTIFYLPNMRNETNLPVKIIAE